MISSSYICADPEGGTSSADPLPEKNIGFLSNTGQDPLKIYNVAKQAFRGFLAILVLIP